MGKWKIWRDSGSLEFGDTAGSGGWNYERWRRYGLESLVKEGRKISGVGVGGIGYGGIEGRKTSGMEG